MVLAEKSKVRHYLFPRNAWVVQRSQEGVRAKWTSKKYRSNRTFQKNKIARRRRREERNRRGDHAEVVEVVGEAAAEVAVRD